MAFSVEVGQPIGEFFSSENETFEQAYTTIYDARLEQLDTLRETFVSLTTTGLLLLVVSDFTYTFQTGAETSNPFEVILRARWVLLTGTLFALLQIEHGTYSLWLFRTRTSSPNTDSTQNRRLICVDRGFLPVYLVRLWSSSSPQSSLFMGPTSCSNSGTTWASGDCRYDVATSRTGPTNTPGGDKS